MKRCIIVGAGEFDGFLHDIKDDDFIIAADGGVNFLDTDNIKADIYIGDFDSAVSKPEEKVISLNTVKDTTDMFEACELAYKLGYSEIIIYAGLGKRLSHTMANISLLEYFTKKNIKISLVSKKIQVYVTSDSLKLNFKKRSYVSVFSLSDVSDGVSIKKLRYELSNEKLRREFAVGVSNENMLFNGEISTECEIIVKEGLLLVVVEDYKWD